MGSRLPLVPYGSIAAWQSSPSNIKYIGSFMIRYPQPMIAHGWLVSVLAVHCIYLPWKSLATIFYGLVSVLSKGLSSSKRNRNLFNGGWLPGLMYIIYLYTYVCHHVFPWVFSYPLATLKFDWSTKTFFLSRDKSDQKLHQHPRLQMCPLKTDMFGYIPHHRWDKDKCRSWILDVRRKLVNGL